VALASVNDVAAAAAQFRQAVVLNRISWKRGGTSRPRRR
jgi:hypothetical protein